MKKGENNGENMSRKMRIRIWKRKKENEDNEEKTYWEDNNGTESEKKEDRECLIIYLTLKKLTLS